MEHFPKKGDKIDSIPGSNVIAGGGPVPNALCTFSKLGGKAALISSFGDDLWGDFARRELDRFGVGHKHCIIRKNCPTPQAFAWIEAGSGDRTIVLSRSEKLRLRSHDIKTSDLPKPKLIHLDGRDMEACLKLARWGKKNGARVMLDVGSVRNRVDELFACIDYLICADQFALNYFGTRSISRAALGFKNLDISEVVVTSGIKGSFGIDGVGNCVRQRAFKIEPVDSTGAGDVFHGSYLYGILRGWSLRKKMRFASAAAALKCRKRGARDGIPSRRQVLTFIKNHKVMH